MDRVIMTLIRFRRRTRFTGKKIKVDSVTYISLKEACRSLNFNYELVRGRLHRGWLPDQAFGLVNRQNDTKFRIKGLKFKSLNSMCKYYKLNNVTVQARIDRGWTLEEALELKERGHSTKCLGKIYTITNNINKKIYIGITTNTLKWRFARHKEAVTRGINTKLCIAMRKHGIANFTISLLEEVDDKYILKEKETLYINQYNSINKGYNSISGGCGLGFTGTKVCYNGIVFENIKDLAKYLKLPYHVVFNRFKKGKPLDSPLNKGTSTTYNGVTYKSLTCLAKKFNISRDTVVNRLKNNIDLDLPTRYEVAK